MKKLILTILFFTGISSAGELTILTHAETHVFGKCKLQGIVLSDISRINEYHLKCRERIGSIPSLDVHENNDISAFYYEDEELFCPIKKAIILNNSNFTLIVDCREWF